MDKHPFVLCLIGLRFGLNRRKAFGDSVIPRKPCALSTAAFLCPRRLFYEHPIVDFGEHLKLRWLLRTYSCFGHACAIICETPMTTFCFRQATDCRSLSSHLTSYRQLQCCLSARRQDMQLDWFDPIRRRSIPPYVVENIQVKRLHRGRWRWMWLVLQAFHLSVGTVSPNGSTFCDRRHTLVGRNFYYVLLINAPTYLIYLMFFPVFSQVRSTIIFYVRLFVQFWECLLSAYW